MFSIFKDLSVGGTNPGNRINKRKKGKKQKKKKKKQTYVYLAE